MNALTPAKTLLNTQLTYTDEFLPACGFSENCCGLNRGRFTLDLATRLWDVDVGVEHFVSGSLGDVRLGFRDESVDEANYTGCVLQFEINPGVTPENIGQLVRSNQSILEGILDSTTATWANGIQFSERARRLIATLAGPSGLMAQSTALVRKLPRKRVLLKNYPIEALTPSFIGVPVTETSVELEYFIHRLRTEVSQCYRGPHPVTHDRIFNELKSVWLDQVGRGDLELDILLFGMKLVTEPTQVKRVLQRFAAFEKKLLEPLVKEEYLERKSFFIDDDLSL